MSFYHNILSSKISGSTGGGSSEELNAVIAEQAGLIEELSATLDEKIGAYEVGYDAGYSAGSGALDTLIDGTITEVNSNVTSIRHTAFTACTNLVSINFPNVTVLDGLYTFQSCTKLKSINLPKLGNLPDKSFHGCSALTSVKFPSVTSVGVDAFTKCYNLESISFSSLMSIGSSVFSNCHSLKSVIIRRQGVTSISSTSVFGNCYHIHGVKNSTYNPNGDKDGYFYVPRAYVDSYKSATNWSTYATQFRALEDYTIDGTIYGELDPNKI